MIGRSSGIRTVAVLGVVVLALGLSTPSAANWLTKLWREAGEASGKGGAKLGPGSLDNAALYVKSLPTAGPGIALAAHATPEGHWRFTNRSSEIFTAGTPDEMKRVVAALAPDAAGAEARLSLYLSEETVFGQQSLLKELPAGARLHVVIGKSGFPLIRRSQGGAERLLAEIRPNVALLLNEERAVAEALFQLSRPLEASRLRVLSLKPDGPDSLKSLPRFDPATKGALVDEIDPNSLGRALGSLSGQTAVVTGRIEGGELRFRPAAGSERAIPLAEIERAAAAADVNLVVLQSAVPAQPGGRNWLWQKVEVAGLDDALKRATFADFLNALGTDRGQLVVEAVAALDGRALLRALPAGRQSEPITGRLGEWLSEVVASVTGNVVPGAVEVMARSEERQRELDARIVPGVPSALQIGYLAGLVAGLMGLPVARRWWVRIWPPETRADYAGGLGYHAARAAKLVAFLLLFLPIAGPLALVAAVAMQLWSLIAAPWRALKWLGGRVARGRSVASG